MHISLWFLIVVLLAYIAGARWPSMARSVGVA